MNTLENILQEIDMEKNYNLLTPRERKIISLYYLAGYTDEEISKFYGISRQIITRLRGKGITKLKKY